MPRKTDKRQNPGARSIRRTQAQYDASTRRAPKGMKLSPNGLNASPINRDALATVLDKLPGVRQKLIKRIERAIRREDIPVAVLHQVAQCIELWSE
jgi:hypothetical protein